MQGFCAVTTDTLAPIKCVRGASVSAVPEDTITGLLDATRKDCEYTYASLL